MKKYILILISVIGLITSLCGCGVSDSDRRILYDEIIEKGDLNLDVPADRYEEIKTVSNAPIPGVTTYYIYKGNNGEKYTFQFIDLGPDDYDYKAKVIMEYGNASTEEDKVIPELRTCNEYLFKKGKITKRIRLVESEQSSYFRRFSETDCKEKCGVRTFNFYNGEVKVYFNNELMDYRIKKCFNNYTEGTVSDFDVILGTDMGKYSAEEIRLRNNENGNAFVVTARIDAEGVPEWIEIDGIRIDVRMEDYNYGINR